ncbi:MAG: hypothetical protein ABUL48_01010 [Pseudorhodoplanes sp.]
MLRFFNLIWSLLKKLNDAVLEISLFSQRPDNPYVWHQWHPLFPIFVKMIDGEFYHHGRLWRRKKSDGSFEWQADRVFEDWSDQQW